ncbi:MAG: metallophosphoesterase [Akkermansiaceae bacterium]|nr:metallophosphoesterase [Akkermansiaceae bacterium]
MSRLKRTIFAGLCLLGLLAAIVTWRQYRAKHPVIQEVPRQGGLEVTLLTMSDLHFGSTILGRDAKGRNTRVKALPVRKEIDGQMRSMTGKPYPQAIGGSVGEPACLLIAGDLTEDGRASEWVEFSSFYGLESGSAGSSSGLPVYECVGNHDAHTGTHVATQVAARHGGPWYAIELGDLHIANLGDGPSQDGLDWLQHDLAKTGRERPVILYMHYPLLGPWSNSYWGWNTPVTERFAALITGFNIVAILHGHYHVPGCYKWHGVDVYNIGSMKHGARCFGVIHVTDDTFTYASWNAEKNGWWWWHSKPINRPTPPATGEEILGSSSSKGLLSRPAIPYPIHLK